MEFKQQKQSYNPLQSTVTIFAMRCTAFLTDRGHEVIAVRPDKRYPSRVNSVFKNTIQLYEDMEEYKDMRARENKESGRFKSTTN